MARRVMAMFTPVVRRFFIVSVFTAACGENPTAPTPPPEKPTITITNVEPPVGATVRNGTLFTISYTKQQARATVVQSAFAFVTNDRAYSAPIACARDENPGGTAPYGISMHSVWGIVGAEWRGNILFEFAKGRRANAVMLFRTEAVTPGVGCAPLSTEIDWNNPPTDGTGAVYPANADQRIDVTLNWFIEP